jgi:hypothetical protein
VSLWIALRNPPPKSPVRMQDDCDRLVGRYVLHSPTESATGAALRATSTRAAPALLATTFTAVVLRRVLRDTLAVGAALTAETRETWA